MINENNHTVLSIELLHKAYDAKAKTVLSDISLHVNARDFICILGPSGCGKSTLLRCILGFEKYEGRILLENAEEGNGLQKFGMVFQDVNQLFPWKTVMSNILYPLKVSGISDRRERIEIAETYLAKVNMLQYKDYYPNQLSGGMKQRAAIARTLALRPQIILMDEPFASLDAMTRNQLEKELLSIVNKEKSTVLFVTHNIQEAIVLSNRIVVISSQGKIIKNMQNNLEKPVSPASNGYGKLWEELNDALHVDVLPDEVRK